MTREIRDIPPSPRLVRWQSVLWHRWLLALFGFFAAVYGGAICLMMLFASGGKPGDDAKLDGGAMQTMGTIDRVVPVDRTYDGRPAARYQYSFVDHQGNERQGGAFATQDHGIPGDSVAVEYLAEEKHIHRLVGGKIALRPSALSPLLWLGRLVFPGILALLLWFQGCFLLRRLMSEGDVGVAEVFEIRRVPVLIPNMLSVTYCFRDHRASSRVGRHWVRTRSALGERLVPPGNESPPSQLPVIHDRRWPQKSRLTICGDYVIPPSEPKQPQGFEAPVP